MHDSNGRVWRWRPAELGLARARPDGPPASTLDLGLLERLVLALQRLGTRAVVAEALADEAEKVDRAVRWLVDAAANGDINAAKGLIPWIDQALGRPVERVEHRAPTGLEDLEFMSTEELERIVREGRARRLQREADDGDDGLV
jgi:hypothetical protein